MAKTIAGKQWGNDQSNALDKPDWLYLDPTKAGFEVYGPALAVTFSSVALSGVFTPDTTFNPTTVLANTGLLIIDGTKYTINVVNSTAFSVTAANATPGYANAHVYADALVFHQHLAETEAGANANVTANVSGWTHQHGWAPETLVAIGGLKMPALTALFMQNLSGPVLNAAAQVLSVRVQMSSGVRFTTANLANVYIVAIGTAANVAVSSNINLLYDATASAPESGVLVFTSAATNLAAYADADTITINSTSTFSGSGNVVSRRQKGTAVLAVSGTLPNTSAIIISLG